MLSLYFWANKDEESEVIRKGPRVRSSSTRSWAGFEQCV
jgi:hypothetical protein